MPATQTRVLLAGVPDLLRAIVRDAVSRADDLRVIGEVADLHAVSTRGAAEHTAGNDDFDVVIASFEDEQLPADALDLMHVRAHIAVLGIVRAGGGAHLWQLRPHCTRLGDVSPDELVTALRGATTPSAADRPRA